ncbi:dienelactone hydrolase family protein [Lignipirellula cremea]|uniref:Dienelactone hydrolase family protein n=1 Tax=Lignipirellula cremea TaxID=2528010 RepID=A0A518E2P9_9BACT|nr:dienelactone hydrolase family protein [Lignipirellula cremea]QDU98366.1 Dienelactone hydrolase family protein [Lignipirellula cremea]
MEWNRRRFLGASAALSGAAAAGWAGAGRAEEPNTEKSPMPDFRERLLQCLGGPWPEPCPLKPELRSTIRRDGFRIESLTYEAEPGDRIPAMLLVPDGVDAQHPAPAIALWHQHNGQWHLGKSEPAGLEGNPMHHTGAALARAGYVVLCPDALCFEERQDEKLKKSGYEQFEFLRYVVAGKCMAWKNILDMRRAVDYLCSRPEVQADNLGCYGHSMGSTHTWLVGPWEPRLKALVGNCCLPTYSAIHEKKLLHCFPNYVPGLYAFGDTPDMAALIAPRALHLNLGELDGGSPIAQARAGCERIAQAYADQNVSEQFRYFIEPDTGHVLSEAMWSRTLEWFDRHLKS